MAALMAFAVTAVACVRPNEHSKDMDGDVARTDHGSCSLATLPGRSAGATCDDTRPTGPLDLLRPTPFLGGCPVFVCSEHDDCTSGENGRCVGNSKDGQYCTYDTCFTDEDCSDQQLDFLATPGEYAVCVCEGGLFSDNNRCVPANCRTDADCPDGGICSPSRAYCGADAVAGYYCHSCDDECYTDADCGGSGGPNERYCFFDAGNTRRWTCGTPRPCPCE